MDKVDYITIVLKSSRATKRLVSDPDVKSEVLEVPKEADTSTVAYPLPPYRPFEPTKQFFFRQGTWTLPLALGRDPQRRPLGRFPDRVNRGIQARSNAKSQALRLLSPWIVVLEEVKKDREEVLAQAKAVDDKQCAEIQARKSTEASSWEVIDVLATHTFSIHLTLFSDSVSRSLGELTSDDGATQGPSKGRRGHSRQICFSPTVLAEVWENSQAMMAPLKALPKGVEATRDKFVSMAQAVFGVLDNLETGPSISSAEEALEKLRKVLMCMLEEARDSVKANICQAFAIMKSLYPRVDIVATIGGFAADCDSEKALELMNKAQEAVDGVVRTMGLQQ
uniref:Uncharacterized protein n=1 Tax=Oryza brachyantha TaxID=4533 RepID=J3LQ25_ORYBR